MRLLLALTFLVFGACAQPTSGKASSDELGKAVVDALLAHDQVGLAALAASAEQAMGSCPRLANDKQAVVDQSEKAHEALEISIANCMKVDWRGAAMIASKGGSVREALDGCPDYQKVHDVTLSITVGAAEYTVRLDDPIALGGRYFLGGLQCAGGASSNPAIAATVAAADQMCGCKDADCANRATAALAKVLKDTSLEGMSPDDARMVGKATKRLAECQQKLVLPAAPKPHLLPR